MYYYISATFIFLIMSLGKVSAQADYLNYWVAGSLNFNHEPPLPEKRLLNFGYSYTDSTGKLLFYGFEDMLYNENDEPILYAERMIRNKNRNIHAVNQIVIPVSSTRFYLFRTIFSVDNAAAGIVNGLYYSVLDMNLNNGKGTLDTMYLNIPVQLVKMPSFMGVNVLNRGNSKYWLITDEPGDTINAYPVDKIGIHKAVRSYCPQEYFSHPYYLYNSYYGKRRSFIFSHDKKFAVAISRVNTVGFIDDPSIPSYSYLYTYNFDINTGKFTNGKMIYKQANRDIDSGKSLHSGAFSPSDSLFYISSTVDKRQPNRSVIMQFERFTSNIAASKIELSPPIPGPYFTLGDIQLAPNGKIYIGSQNSLSNKYFGTIRYPDIKGTGCKLQWETREVDFTDIGRQPAWGFPYTQDYIKVKFLQLPGCGGYTNFINVSDKRFDKFQWYFCDSTGKILDSAVTRSAQYKFATPSAYYVKMRAYLPNGYSAWYSDSVYYKPLLITANFTSKDTAGCQYTGFQFTNQSTADTIHPVKRESFLWDFGDGTTDTARNPLHIFTKPGSYFVSLIYNNGFCTDTFTQQQKVEILAAPKPGFAVSDTLGCIPFTIQAKDNSIGAVTKYTYTFGNEFTSNNTNAEYTFTKPGIYYITQKLLSPTGCITSDSVRVRVREGILPDEKPEMLRAAFTNNATVEISWRKHALAQYYTVYKKQGSSHYAVLSKHFTDTVYMDDAIDLREPFSYYITATDSCGNTSDKSLIAKPIVLSGKNNNNIAFALNYTPYENWENGVAEYYLQYQVANDSFINISSTQNTFIADSFRSEVKNHAQCYRIMARENSGNQQVSYSNTVCLAHIPQVFIPNAFSPNQDLINDVFEISTIGITEVQITIFNRWGERIYENLPGSKISWDGNYNSTPAPEDVYLYTLTIKQADGKNIYRTGTIHLLR